MNQGIDCPCCGRKSQNRDHIESITKWVRELNSLRGMHERLQNYLVLIRMGFYRLARRTNTTQFTVTKSEAEFMPHDWQDRIIIRKSNLDDGGMVYEIAEIGDSQPTGRKNGAATTSAGETGGSRADDPADGDSIPLDHP